MLKSLRIESFRGFQSFELNQLGRINLLVGENNSGKTSILEAVQLLSSRTDLEPLGELMDVRGEYLIDRDQRRSREFDIRQLFFGHEIKLNQRFVISGLNKHDSLERLSASIGVRHVRPDYESISASDEFDKVPNVNLYSDSSGEEFKVFNIAIKWSCKEETESLERPLSLDGGLSVDYIRRGRLIGISKSMRPKIEFVKSSSLKTDEMKQLFDKIAGTTLDEPLVHEAIQTIEPKIEKIIPITSERFSRGARSGFLVRLSDVSERIPIGSMGDGVWRMLGLALAIVNAKEGGVLLVDEIDTGLHFSTMANLWKMIWKTSSRLGVQVFATTHSRDCWESLAEVVESEGIADGEVTIHRIDRDKSHSVVFDAEMIVIAANQEIEVR